MVNTNENIQDFVIKMLQYANTGMVLESKVNKPVITDIYNYITEQ